MNESVCWSWIGSRHENPTEDSGRSVNGNGLGLGEAAALGNADALTEAVALADGEGETFATVGCAVGCEHPAIVTASKASHRLMPY